MKNEILVIRKFNNKTKMVETYKINLSSVDYVVEDEELFSRVYFKNGNSIKFDMESMKNAKLTTKPLGEMIDDSITYYNDLEED
jgi:hypothetical protein